MSITIAFNTANLVAQFSGYKFELKNWGEQHKQVVAHTGPEEWDEICHRIAACGYRAIEVWVAHVEKCYGDESRADQFLRSMHARGLCPVSLAGPLHDVTGSLCRRLGIPAACGGYWGSDKETSRRVMRETGVLFNYENHPEKSIDDIRAAIDFGANGFAIALDTGWLGTQGIDAPKAVRNLGRLIRHVHLKDVAAMGGHQTVKLGTGCTDIPAVISELKAIGYAGVLSWEDEPENRNPFDIAAEMHDYIETQWSKG